MKDHAGRNQPVVGRFDVFHLEAEVRQPMIGNWIGRILRAGLRLGEFEQFERDVTAGDHAHPARCSGQTHDQGEVGTAERKHFADLLHAEHAAVEGDRLGVLKILLRVGARLWRARGGDDATGKSEDLLGLAPLPETIEHRTGGDPSQNLARAAELLAQAQRPGAAEAGKAAVLTHARDPRWADDFGARVSLMIRAGESTASLQLTPVDMGPVEVNVTVKDSQASIHFGASQADTRALIEASLPRLRELLASQGFNLMDASVSSGFSRSQQSAFASGSRGGSEAETAIAEAQPVRQLGLLDLYA